MVIVECGVPQLLVKWITDSLLLKFQSPFRHLSMFQTGLLCLDVTHIICVFTEYCFIKHIFSSFMFLVSRHNYTFWQMFLYIVVLIVSFTKVDGTHFPDIVGLKVITH